jgi:hypothetical protein
MPLRDTNCGSAADQDTFMQRLAAVVRTRHQANRGERRVTSVRLPLKARRALEPLLEALDLAGGVNDCLLAREERVAIRADVDAQRLLR